jgi:hypothetical protein
VRRGEREQNDRPNRVSREDAAEAAKPGEAQQATMQPMRVSIVLLSGLLLGAQGSWVPDDSSPPPDFRPPDAQGVCPGLVEDYQMCSDDLWSGNCPDLVTAAGRLGEIYRSEVARHPSWIDELRTTVWWGCGEATFQELGALLERIDSPQARAVLAEEPYRSLRLPPKPAPAPPAPPPTAEPNCEAPSTQAERDACAAVELRRAKAEHDRVFAACQKRVARALHRELTEAEASWEKDLPLECPGTGQVRDECLANAYRERTGSIGSMHPECAGPSR